MTSKISFSAAQCRAARALLNWSQKDLSKASLVGTKTIADFERGARSAPYDRTLRDLRETLEAAGIEFTNGNTPGLRLKPGVAPAKSSGETKDQELRKSKPAARRKKRK